MNNEIELNEERFENPSFFKRMGILFKGLKCPIDTREYKLRSL